MNNFCAILDIGGSGIKLSCRSQDGNVCFFEHETLLPVYSNRSATQSPDKVFEVILRLLKKVGKKLQGQDKIVEIYISTLRQGFALIRDGRELTPLIYNSDTTGLSARKEIYAYGFERIYRETGHWYAPQLTLPKLINLKLESPSFFEGDVSLLFFHDWVIWKLTGHKTSEASLLAAGQIWNLQNSQTHFDLLRYFGFSGSLICPIKNFGSYIDTVNWRLVKEIGVAWRNCKVMVGGGDSHFLHYGASAQESMTIVVSAGSSTPISIVKKRYDTFLDMQPWISPTLQKKHFFIEGNLGYPGLYFNWIREAYGGKVIKASSFQSPLLNRIPVVLSSCHFWSQEGWERRPPFTIVDFRSSHTSGDVALSLLIDYAIGVKNQMSVLDQAKQANIIMTGGGANPTLARLLATFLDRNVSINYSNEVGLDAIDALAGRSLQSKLKRFDPEGTATRRVLLDFEELHKENYYKSLGARELIDSVHST